MQEITMEEYSKKIDEISRKDLSVADTLTKMLEYADSVKIKAKTKKII